MAADEPLRRLGSGRWQSRDGRFTIEPQSGTWVVVDGERTDELGLPLVRGPFGSLTAAREDIETARSQGPVQSPLAERLEHPPQRSQKVKPATLTSPPPKQPKSPAKPEPRPKKPALPPEPAWLRKLEPPRRRAAKEMITRLEKLGIRDAETIARAEVAADQPALARRALELRIPAAVSTAKDPKAVAKAVVDVILAGRDEKLGARWRLVDGEGRPLSKLDVSDQGRE